MTIPNWKPTYPQPLDEQYTTGWSDDPEIGVENLISGEVASELAKSFDRKNRRYPANIPKGLKEISRVSTSLDDTTFKVKYNCKYIRMQRLQREADIQQYLLYPRTCANMGMLCLLQIQRLSLYSSTQ